MKKVIIFGIILAVFLLLMILHVNSIEYLSDEPAICDTLFLIYVFFAFKSIFLRPLANVIYAIGSLIGCDWAVNKTSLTTNICNCDGG